MTRFLPLILALLLFQPVVLAQGIEGGDTDDDGDADPEELFKPFDTGLYFKRRMYLKGDVVTHITYYPTIYNDTRDIGHWKTNISHMEQDPPGFVNVYIYDDSPHNSNFGKSEIDLMVTINHYDHDYLRNLVETNRRVLRGIPIEKGMTKIPFNIHNYKGDIVVVKLLDVRQRFSIKPIDVVD